MVRLTPPTPPPVLDDTHPQDISKAWWQGYLQGFRDAAPSDTPAPPQGSDRPCLRVVR